MRKSESFYVSKDNICGKVIVEKNENNDIIVNESLISKIISGRPVIEEKFNSSKEIIDKIKDILIGMCFTSRYMGMDMYTNKLYEDNSKEFYNKYIYGIHNIYNVPAGIVMFHKSSELLFQCTNIEFMVSQNIIPFKYTNIKQKIYLVKRTNGDIQNACILYNGGLFFKKDTLYISNNFASNKHEILHPKAFNEYEKSLPLHDFLDLNNLKLEITLPYFDNSIINSQSNILKGVLNYYNDKLKEFQSKMKLYNLNYLKFTL